MTRAGGRRGVMWVAGAVGAVLVAGTAAASSSAGQQGSSPPDAVTELQREVDAMRADGLPADHPKVRMLEREIGALEAGSTATTVPDPGMSGAARGARAASPVEAAELADELGADQSAEAGTVECEPVPQALTAAEVAAAASCLSVPQPDGTSRYLAVEPEGTVHVVSFGDDGRVTRLEDRELPAEAAAAGDDDDVTLVPEPDGSVTVVSDGVEVATLDLG